MTAQEILQHLPIRNHYFGAIIRDDRNDPESLLDHGCLFPSTPAQAGMYISKNARIEILNSKDILRVEESLNEHEYKGDYALSPSGRYATLINEDDFKTALKKKFQLTI